MVLTAASVLNRARRGKLIGRRKEIRKGIADYARQNPVKIVEGVTRGIEKGIKKGAHSKGVHSVAKQGLKTGTVKDLAVNTGGFTASKAGAWGGRMTGIPGASKAAELAGDYGGARFVRGAINKGYADVAAWKQRKPGEKLSETRKRAQKKRGTMQKIDKRNNANTEDRVGWAIGNAGAEGLDRLGVGVPLKGAAVAMRAGGHVSDNIKAYSKGKKTAGQAAKDAGKGIVKSNIVDPAVKAKNLITNPEIRKDWIKKKKREGLKREAKLKRKVNKFAQKAVGRADREGYEFSECNKKRRRRKRRRR